MAEAAATKTSRAFRVRCAWCAFSTLAVTMPSAVEAMVWHQGFAPACGTQSAVVARQCGVSPRRAAIVARSLEGPNSDIE